MYVGWGGVGGGVCVGVTVGVGVIVWVGVGMIAWVRKGVCGWYSLNCCCKVCVGGECEEVSVSVIVWVCGCDCVGVEGSVWVVQS